MKPQPKPSQQRLWVLRTPTRQELSWINTRTVIRLWGWLNAFRCILYHVNGKGFSRKSWSTQPEISKYKWVARWPDGTTRDWDTTVRASIEAMGIPRSHIMRHVQAHEGDGPALPLCPLSNQPPGFVAGINLLFKGQSVFEPIP